MRGKKADAEVFTQRSETPISEINVHSAQPPPLENNLKPVDLTAKKRKKEERRLFLYVFKARNN